jgi:hypothetical protein
MALSIVKETIELNAVTTDQEGNAYITKRINLDAGKRHQLVQVDMFEDAYATEQVEIETVITPYPAVPTNMFYSPFLNITNRYPAGGDDSVLFKERRQLRVNVGDAISTSQFPSSEIAAMNATQFYTDHVYINMHIMSLTPESVVENIAFSFLLVLNDKSVSNLEHSIGVLSESHEAMCAQVMSNGRMQSRQTLYGNVFPMWRYGGIRPERMITPIAANAFFLDIATRDAENMSDTFQIRSNVADARQMQPFDTAFGIRRPDWLREFLNAGFEAGPIRPNPVPLRKANNGNTRMF